VRTPESPDGSTKIALATPYGRPSWKRSPKTPVVWLPTNGSAWTLSGSALGSKPTIETFAGIGARSHSSTVTWMAPVAGSATFCVDVSKAVIVTGCCVGLARPPSYG
jgi:hypothetical protein